MGLKYDATRPYKWRCPTCKLWVREKIGQKCQECKEKQLTFTQKDDRLDTYQLGEDV